MQTFLRAGASDAVLRKASPRANVVPAGRLHDALLRERSESSLDCEMRLAIAFLFVVSANYVKSVNGGCSFSALMDLRLLVR